MMEFPLLPLLDTAQLIKGGFFTETGAAQISLKRVVWLRLATNPENKGSVGTTRLTVQEHTT